MGNITSKLGGLAALAALATTSCETANPVDTTQGACTNPKLNIMSDDVALAVKIVVFDMESINLGNLTKIVHADFLADDGTPSFKNVAMLVDEKNAYKCEETQQMNGTFDQDHIFCGIGTVDDLKKEPVRMANFRTIALNGRTISVNQPITSQQPIGTEWISVSDTTCGARDRFGISASWCAGRFSEAQLAVDSSRESVCTKDFEKARDLVRGALDAYHKRLAK